MITLYYIDVIYIPENKCTPESTTLYVQNKHFHLTPYDTITYEDEHTIIIERNVDNHKRSIKYYKTKEDAIDALNEYKDFIKPNIKNPSLATALLNTGGFKKSV